MPGPTAPEDDKRAIKTLRAPVAWVVLIVVLASGLTFDLGLKAWCFTNVAGRPVVLDRAQVVADPDHNPIPPHLGRHVLPWDLLDLRLVLNPGAVFGIGANQRVFFIFFTLAALAVGLYVFAFRTRHGEWTVHIAIGLILAGGLGNLFDRVMYGRVRDFLHMLPGWELPFGWTWPGGSPEIFPWVFNTADVMLLTGMGLLLIHLHRLDRTKKAIADAEADSPADEPTVTEPTVDSPEAS